MAASDRSWNPGRAIAARRRRLALAGLAAALLAVGAPGAADAGPPTATTSSGRLVGVSNAITDRYLGVRYAQAGRWQLPRPAARASGEVDASKPGAACAQASALPGSEATNSTSEDCLFLNVTLPEGTHRGDDLPLMVWLHGGGFQSGSGALYDAQRLASQGHVAVVTVNYRLGIFGYLSWPGLRGSGNFGLADQFAATRWAKRNARALGADPKRLTVFGESAGGMSACGMLTSPAARGLIDQVAISSGSCNLEWPKGALFPGVPAARPFISRKESEELGELSAAQLGCAGNRTLDCLRRQSTDALLTTSVNFGNPVAYGTGLLPEDPRRALRRGDVLRVPVLSGGNRDEHRSFLGGAALLDPSGFADYPALLDDPYGSDAARVAAAYPLAKYGSPLLAFSTVVTDGSWACPTLAANQAMARDGLPVYAYEFADRNAPDVNGISTASFDAGAAHASDIPSLFDLGGKDLLASGPQRALSRTMIQAWSSFARSGRPSIAGAPWAALQPHSNTARQFSPGKVFDIDVERRHHCALWRSIA